MGTGFRTIAARIEVYGTKPSVPRLGLAGIHKPLDLSPESLLQKRVEPVCKQPTSTGDLEINAETPTPLNELQSRFFTDVIHYGVTLRDDSMCLLLLSWISCTHSCLNFILLEESLAHRE